MKKGFILIFMLMILTTSLASAEIFFKETKDSNLGDSVNIEGWIEENEDVREIFRLYLDCGDSIQLYAKMFNVEADKKYYFNENVNLFGGYKGECSFRATFNDESKSSDKFNIVDELEGNVFVNENSFSLGDILKVEGDIFKVNKNRVSIGWGIIHLSENGEDFLVDTFEFYDGNIDYSIILEKLPSGNYDLEWEVFDGFGNSGNFEIGIVDISDVLHVDIKLDKEYYLPGDELWINGDVDANEYWISFELNDETFSDRFEDEEFDYSFKLKDNIKSGPNSINIIVEDEYGNYHKGELNFDITPVPTGLEVKVDEESYLPGDIVEIFLRGFDQADDLYENIINLRILNPKEILNIDVNSGTVYGFELEKYSKPGNYNIIAKNTDFEEEIVFVVNELVEIDAYYDEDRLKIINIGNMPIDDKVIVYLDDESFTFDLKSKPSEIESYNLRKYIEKDGNYNIIVGFNNKEFDIGNVYIEKMGFIPGITGAVIGGGIGDWIIYIVIFIIIILVLVFFIYKPDKKSDFSRQKDFREGQEKLRKRRAEKEKKKPRKLFQAKDINEKDAKQFRESMVKKMKEK